MRAEDKFEAFLMNAAPLSAPLTTEQPILDIPTSAYFHGYVLCFSSEVCAGGCVCAGVKICVRVCVCVKCVLGCVRAGVYVYVRVYMVGIADSAHLRRLRTCAHAHTYAQSIYMLAGSRKRKCNLNFAHVSLHTQVVGPNFI
jgi:hypothetical protein